MSADLVPRLHPPRLPPDFTQMGWADLLAGFGLGLILAALLIWIALPFLRKRRRPPTLAQQLREIRTLPPPDRLLALTRLLARRKGQLPDDLRHALYATPSAPPQEIADRVEALILAADPPRARPGGAKVAP